MTAPPKRPRTLSSAVDVLVRPGQKTTIAMALESGAYASAINKRLCATRLESHGEHVVLPTRLIGGPFGTVGLAM